MSISSQSLKPNVLKRVTPTTVGELRAPLRAHRAPGWERITQPALPRACLSCARTCIRWGGCEQDTVPALKEPTVPWREGTRKLKSAQTGRDERKVSHRGKAVQGNRHGTWHFWDKQVLIGQRGGGEAPRAEGEQHEGPAMGEKGPRTGVHAGGSTRQEEQRVLPPTLCVSILAPSSEPLSSQVPLPHSLHQSPCRPVGGPCHRLPKALPWLPNAPGTMHRALPSCWEAPHAPATCPTAPQTTAPQPLPQGPVPHTHTHTCAHARKHMRTRARPRPQGLHTRPSSWLCAQPTLSHLLPLGFSTTPWFVSVITPSTICFPFLVTASRVNPCPPHEATCAELSYPVVPPHQPGTVVNKPEPNK